VRLEEIPPGGLRVETDVSQEKLELLVPPGELGFNLQGPVHADLFIRRRGKDILAQIKVKARLELACHRCLARVERDVDSEAEITFVPHPKVEEGVEMELAEQDLGVEFYDGEALNLGEVVLEQLAVEIPVRVLCSEACRGICPRCGAQLNTEACRCCEGGPKDPRFAELTKLKLE
jgi:uncharacterized protein